MNKGSVDVRKFIGAAIKLRVICLLVGWVLSVIEIAALGFIRFLSRSVRNAGELAADGVRWTAGPRPGNGPARAVMHRCEADQLVTN